MNCPNCSGATERLALAGVYGPDIELDLCFACHLIWLDKRESLHLAPRGTLALFQRLHEHRDDPRHALGGRTACPRCGRRLSLQHDIGKGGRFSYFACPEGHGRLTPFSEFLKEKQFVRTLTPLEQSRLRAEVRTVPCAGCGAPVDVATAFECAHCGSPITVLDADAVEKTLRQLQDADAARSGDPDEAEVRAHALASIERLRTEPSDPWGRLSTVRGRPGIELGTDLLSASIGFLFGRF